MIGLNASAEAFPQKRGKGVPFRAFARNSIKWEIQCALRKLQMIRLPKKVGSLAIRIKKTEKLLGQREGRHPLFVEVAQELGLRVEEVYDIPSAYSRPASLDTPLAEDSDDSLLAVLPDERQFMPDRELIEKERKNEIARALKMLDPVEAKVVDLFFGLSEDRMAIEEIGVFLDLSFSQVKQKIEKAIRVLKREATNLKLYLGE